MCRPHAGCRVSGQKPVHVNDTCDVRRAPSTEQVLRKPVVVVECLVKRLLKISLHSETCLEMWICELPVQRCS